MRTWTVEYIYAEQRFELRDCPYVGTYGDWVYLWGQEFRILSVRYFPERGVVYVSLTKEIYL